MLVIHSLYYCYGECQNVGHFKKLRSHETEIYDLSWFICWRSTIATNNELVPFKFTRSSGSRSTSNKHPGFPQFSVAGPVAATLGYSGPDHIAVPPAPPTTSFHWPWISTPLAGKTSVRTCCGGHVQS